MFDKDSICCDMILTCNWNDDLDERVSLEELDEGITLPRGKRI